MKIHIIANPIAGGGRGALMAERLDAALRRRGIQVEVFTTTRRGDAESEARQSTADCIVAVGGDGAVNETVNGLRGKDQPMTALPVGTANVVAKELGLRPDAEQIAEVVRGGRRRRLDAGECGGRLFLLGAGAGLDAAVVEQVHAARRGGRLHYGNYVGPAWQLLQQGVFPRIRVLLDGEELDGAAEYVVVGNCKRSAGLLCITPEAELDDGLLDVCCIDQINLLRTINLGLAACMPGFSRRDDIRYKKGREVELTPASGRVPLQIDGDPMGELPAAIRVAPAAVQFLVPEQRDGSAPADPEGD